MFFFVSSSYAQYTFNGRIGGYSLRELKICSQFGDDSKLIATVETDITGEFNYEFVDREKGLYRIYLDSQDYFDIIFNNENIELITKTDNLQYNMIIEESEENKQLYEYITADMGIGYKIDILKQFLDIYPEGKFYKTVENELNTEIKNKDKIINKIIKQNPGSFASRYIEFLREFPVPVKYNDAEKSVYIKENYWKYYKMNDLDLLYSNAYSNAVINYFKLLRPFNEQSYYEAVRTIMDNIFFEDPKISAFVLEYILSGFELMGFNDASSKLSYEYGNICKDNDENNNLNLRIKSNTDLAIGKKAPDILAETITGHQYTLSSMTKDYTLIIFWASWCDHCAAMLPELAKSMWYFSNVDLVAISIDTDEDELNNFIIEKKIPSDLKIICDYQGWKSEIISDYAVFATPVMYIVDKELNIVSKPYNEERLVKELNNLLQK